MSKGFLIVIFILSSFLIYGQDKWCHYRTTIAGLSYEMGEFCGDTIIDNKKYEIILTSFFNISDLSYSGSGLGGYRRISNDSVYYLHSTDPRETEKLLYVFNLNVDDKIILINFEKDTFKVLKVDTVNLFGKNKRRIYLRNVIRNYINDDIWIEDIGSIIHGYLWSGLSPYIADDGSSFSCYYDSKSGQTYSPYDSLPCHLDKLVKACSIPSSNKNISEGKISFISPNPFDKLFDLYTKDAFIEVSLFNVNGELVKFLSYYGNHMKIDCKELPSGLYIVKLKIGRELEIFKILKN